MKILHTSDWHIGRNRNDKNFDETLKYFFDWLILTIQENNVDVLIVAGDIFDNPFPASTSMNLYYNTLLKISKTNIKHIIITGGNHDSSMLLNAPRDILKLLNITVVGGMPDNIGDVIIQIKNNEKTELVVCAVPYLREKDVRKSFSGGDYEHRQEQISAGIEFLYKQIAEKIKIFKEQNIPIVATGHLFINDISEVTEKEREMFIGGLQQLSIRQLPNEFDYFALGHIHRPMKVGGRENCRYSGSPIKLAYGEASSQNQVVIVDFENNDIKVVYVPQFRHILKVIGTFNEVSEFLKNYKDESELKAWASLEIIEPKVIPDLEEKLNELRIGAKNVEIVKSSFRYTDIETDIEKRIQNNPTLSELTPEQIFDSILKNTNDEEKDELKSAFIELINNYLYNED